MDNRTRVYGPCTGGRRVPHPIEYNLRSESITARLWILCRTNAVGSLSTASRISATTARQASNLRSLFGAQKLAVAAMSFSAGISRLPIHYCTPKMAQLLTVTDVISQP